MKRRNGDTEKRRKGEGEKVTGNQVIRLSGNQDIRKSGSPDHPITRSPDTPIPRFPDSPIHRFPDSKKAGFTILEAMVALVILSLALLALLRVMPVGIKASKLAEETTIATMLAQKKIEEARATVPWPPSSVTKTNLGSEGYPNFEYIRNITSVTPTTYLREVTVSIFWPAGASSQRTVALKTHVAKYE